jgi:hypothetical protein
MLISNGLGWERNAGTRCGRDCDGVVAGSRHVSKVRRRKNRGIPRFSRISFVQLIRSDIPELDARSSRRAFASLSLSLSPSRNAICPFTDASLRARDESRSVLRPPSARTRRSRWLAGSRVKGEKGADLSKRRRRKREKIGCLGRGRRCERKACMRADLDGTGKGEYGDTREY